MKSQSSDKQSFRFDHERLETYQVSLEWLRQSEIILRSIPRGESDIAKQLKRSSSSIVLNIAEGVGRTGKARANFYRIAKASACEAAATVDVLEIKGVNCGCNPKEKLQVLYKMLQRLIATV